jgi:hypothetical protein
MENILLNNMGDLAEGPRLLGISVVKNEQDIIEPFVRHNLRFLDWLIVLDNGSEDGTKDILARLEREHSMLIVAHDDEFGHTQFTRMNELLRIGVSRYHPDYVIPLDADEFLGASQRGEFCCALESIPRGGCGLLPWRTFVITLDTIDACATDPPLSFRWRRREELPAFYKVILRTDGEPVDELEIDFGSHNIHSTSGREIPRVTLDPFNLLHFPVRSRDQFAARIVIGWMANLTRDPNVRSSGLGWQKRDNFDRIARGGPIDDAALCELSLLYAQNSKPIDWQLDVVAEVPRVFYVRRYSDGKAMDAIQLVARAWEGSLLKK